jgi:predicted nucleic acid-binding protein
MFAGRRVSYVPIDSALIEAAMQIGTSAFLRGADALYAATAQLTGSQLISQDQELIRRAGAISPTDWLISVTGI